MFALPRAMQLRASKNIPLRFLVGSRKRRLSSSLGFFLVCFVHGLYSTVLWFLRVWSVRFCFVFGCLYIPVQVHARLSWSHGDGDVVASPGRLVIDGGSRGAGGVATQVAQSSCVNVAEADTHESVSCAGNADSQHEWGVDVMAL